MRVSDWHDNELMQESLNSIANVLELRLSCINPSINRISSYIENQK